MLPVVIVLLFRRVFSMKLNVSPFDSFTSNYESFFESNEKTAGSGGNTVECFQWLSLGEFFL